MKYITDMSICTPSSAISPAMQPHRWRAVEYESEDICGTMLLASALADAPDVACPLEMQGWHAVSIGYWHPNLVAQVDIKVRLSGDPCFVTIADDEADPGHCNTLREVFWKYADLSGQEILFGQQSKGTGRPACVAYLKLEPLSDAQVQRILADRADKTTRTVIAANDGASWLTTKAVTTADDIREQIEPYRHSDVYRVDWAVCYGDMTNYPSKVGFNYYEPAYHYDVADDNEKRIAESLRAIADQGLVLHRVAMEHAHSMGLEFHVMIRTGIGQYTPPYDAQGGFMAEHPEMRLVAPDGTALPKLSYAFAEVRKRMLAIVEEVLDDEIDGVNLCWMRGTPVVGFEKPVVDAFRERYGEAPADADDDPRLWRVRAEFITDFMREVRKLTRRVGERRGRPVNVTAMVSGSTLEHILARGYDLQTWFDEKLVDDITAAAVNAPFIRAHGVRQHIYMGANESACRQGVQLTSETGAPGMTVWDMNLAQDLHQVWDLLRRLGHKEQIIEGKSDLPRPRRVTMKSIAGIDVMHTTGWGGGEQALIIWTNG